MRFVPCLASSLLLAPSAFAQETKLDAKGIEFFETKIRPVLGSNATSAIRRKPCQARSCAAMLLDSKAGMLKGGDSGPALVPGKAKESLHHQGAAASTDD